MSRSRVCASYYTYLNVCTQFLKDLVDLIFEPPTQHLIGFIQNKHFDKFWTCRGASTVKFQFGKWGKRTGALQFSRVLTQMSPGEHVIHTPWCAYNYMGSACRELVNFRADISPTDAGVAACLHVVTQRQNNLLDLQREDRGKQAV